MKYDESHFNMDTGCVKLLLRNGRKAFSDCTVVEDADLILNGNPEEYLKNVAGSHGLED